LLKRKKDLKQKYLKIHQMCAFGDNFFTNTYKMLKIVNNIRPLALKSINIDEKLDSKREKENIDILKSLHGRIHKRVVKN